MPSKNTDYGITLKGLVDLSQARKDIESFTNNKGENRARKIILDADIKLDDVSKKLDNAINKNLIKKVDDSMQRISTKVKDFKKTLYDTDGNVAGFENLTKVTETLQSNLGKVQERVTIFDNTMKPVTSSVQTLSEGVKNITTETNSYITSLNGMNTKITTVTEKITDTSGKTTEVIKKTSEWIDAQGRLNQQVETTNKEGEQLSATINTISNDSSKAAKLLNEFAQATNKIQAPKNQKTSTITYVDKNGVQTTKQLIDNVVTLITKTREYTTAQGALVKETKTLNTITGDTKVHTEVIKNKQQEIEKSRELQEQLRKEREERVKTQQQIDNGLVSTKTFKSTGMVTQFGTDKQYNALITTIEKVDEANRKVIQTTHEFTDAQGYLVKQTRITDENGRKLAADTIEISNATNKASNGVKNLGDSAERANYGVRNLGWSLSDAFSRLANFYLASLPLRALQNGISNAVETVKEFDSALIEFRKVSDLAGESLTRYVAKLAEMGEITGSTMQAMVEASTEFRKSGFTDEDSAKLAVIAEKYRNIADEEISAGESASFIIAQMKAFNIEAGQAEHIIDAVYL
jgi:chromosome segregation ATPase